MNEKSVISSGGEVIVPASGETPEDISRASVVRESGIILGGDLNVIKPFKFLTPPFLALTISNGASKNQMVRRAQGKSIVHLHNSDLKQIKLFIPKINEQKKISSFFQKLDTLLVLYQRKIGLLQQLKKAMLQRLFPDTDTYPKLRFDGFSDPWEQHKLGEVTTSYSGGTPKAGEEKYYSGNIPFIRSAEINSSTTELFISELGLNSSSAKLVSKGMILYALYGATSGEVGISKIDGAINQAILALTPVEKYDSIFISQYLKLIKGKIVQKYLQGGQGNLSASIVKNIDIKFPDCDEQLKISQFLTKFDTLITLQQHKLDNMHELKKFMLQNLFL